MNNFDFSKRWHVVVTIIFAISCIWFLNVYLGMTYSNEGSWDVVTGAFVETFILTVFFEYFNSRQMKNTEKHLQEHLRKVERLIERKEGNK